MGAVGQRVSTIDGRDCDGLPAAPATQETEESGEAKDKRAQALKRGSAGPGCFLPPQMLGLASAGIGEGWHARFRAGWAMAGGHVLRNCSRKPSRTRDATVPLCGGVWPAWEDP
jgi:hypothetical protein